MRDTVFSLAPLAALVLLVACDGTMADAPLGQAQQGQTLAVPANFTLQEAVAQAQPGDTIQVGAGDFLADVTVEDRDLTIVGAGPGLTTLRRTINVRASGFALRDVALVADGASFGLHARGFGARVENVDVSGYSFGIAAFDSGAVLTVDRSVVRSNQWGFYLQNVPGLIKNTLVLNNAKAGVFARANVRVSVFHNTIVGNGFSNPGEASGGVVAGPAGVENVRNNIVVGNHTGLNCNACTSQFVNNNVWGNVVDYAGDDRHVGDISGDPLFVAPASRDFRLRAGSPCIGAGGDLNVDADADGNPRPPQGAQTLGAYEFVAPSAPVVVNEVMANPLVESSGEYVELYNPTALSVQVGGFRLDDGDQIDEIVGWNGGPTLIPPGGYAVVLDRDFDGDHDIAPGTVLLGVADGRLGNGLSVGDPIALRAPDGRTLVSSYSAPFDPGNGVSAERTADGFVASPCTKSPGAPNCADAPPPPADDVLLMITEVMANPLVESTGEFVEIINFGEDPVDLAGFVLSDGDSDDVLEGFDGDAVVPGRGAYAVIVDPDYDGVYAIPAGVKLLTVVGNRTLGNGLTTNDPVTLRDPGGALVGSYTHPFDPGNGRSVQLQSFEGGDRAGNWAAAPCGHSAGRENCVDEVPDEPEDLPLLQITEVMANPLVEDTGEFVEIYNAGDVPVDLAGLTLSDGDALDQLLAFPGGGTVLAPGAYALVLDPEYNGDYTLPAGVLRLRPDDTTIGSGLATDDVVELRMADGATVISAYRTPFNPGNGRSAEWDGAQWVGSTCATRSSPGQWNCAAGEPPPGPAAVRVIITEVMANPIDERTGEYVELLNQGEAPVDLAGYIVFDGDDTDVIEGFEGGSTVVPAGGFAVILDRQYAGQYVIPAAAVRLTVPNALIGSGLSTNDPVELIAPDGVTVVDRYGPPFDPGNGVSAVRAAPDSDQWVAEDCADGASASPGGVNCVWRDGDPALCRVNADCDPGLRCLGAPRDLPEWDQGLCRDISNRPGEGANCQAHEDCGPGQICGGLAIFRGNGMCMGDYHFGAFSSDERRAIPDGGAALQSTLVVYGLATVPLDVWLRVHLDHPAPQQLRIELTGASGDVARVFSPGDDPAILNDQIIIRAIPSDDIVLGRWVLTVTDTVGGQAGHLNGWDLEIISNWD